MDALARSGWVKQQAQQLGFALCGISTATQLQQEARDLEQWLREGRHGSMAWMENHFDKRIDPRLLVEGAKTVVTVLHNYFPQPQHQQPEAAPKISKYAWGEDYHRVLKHKMHRLLEQMQAQFGEIHARVFTDSAPVMDKAWAKRSGLGWIGKHTNLIVPQMGSWFFIGELITDLDLAPDGPIRDHCGTCTRCIDACPTGALEPYRIDSRRCISYLTIELRENMPDEFRGRTKSWVYGCDICQDVCPWNSFAQAATGDDFKPLDAFLHYGDAEWTGITEREFKKLTRHSAMSRVKHAKFMDSLGAAKGQAPAAGNAAGPD